MAPPLLPRSPAAGEAGRKFSMKQRRHAARWLTCGAQGHWCWLEKANTIFYRSNCFRSKFGRVKHSNGGKYNPSIPSINNMTSAFKQRGLKHANQTVIFCKIFLWIPFPFSRRKTFQCNGFSFRLKNSGIFLTTVLKRITEMYFRLLCLIGQTMQQCPIGCILSLCKNITGLTKELICQGGPLTN